MITIFWISVTIGVVIGLSPIFIAIERARQVAEKERREAEKHKALIAEKVARTAALQAKADNIQADIDNRLVEQSLKIDILTAKLKVANDKAGITTHPFVVSDYDSAPRSEN